MITASLTCFLTSERIRVMVNPSVFSDRLVRKWVLGRRVFNTSFNYYQLMTSSRLASFWVVCVTVVVRRLWGTPSVWEFLAAGVFRPAWTFSSAKNSLSLSAFAGVVHYNEHYAAGRWPHIILLYTAADNIVFIRRLYIGVHCNNVFFVSVAVQLTAL